MSSNCAYALSTLAIVLHMVFPPIFGAPRQRYSVEDISNSFDRSPIHKFYLPVEIAPAALLGAFKAHARNSLHGGAGSDAEVPLDLIQKRTTSSLEVVDPMSAAAMAQEPSMFSGMKRKMFWQPLGYMPASARAQNSGGKSGSGGRNAQHENGSNVFRYG